jgi:hypothetical protein
VKARSVEEGPAFFRSELSQRCAALENQTTVEQPGAVKQMQGAVQGNVQQSGIASAVDVLILAREIYLRYTGHFMGPKWGQRVRRADPTRLIAGRASSLTSANNSNAGASPSEKRKITG